MEFKCIKSHYSTTISEACQPLAYTSPAVSHCHTAAGKHRVEAS